MEPRRRAAAAPSPTTIEALSDDLLVRCLASLTQEDRFHYAALVSKRFRAACLAPQLLHSITVCITEERTLVPRLTSLLGFLIAHAAHVRCLFLNTRGAEQDCHRVAAFTTSCLTACAAGGSLEVLRVGQQTPLADATWLVGLTSLRQLSLGCADGAPTLPAGMSRLSRLVDARLCGAAADFSGRPRLLGCLTQLTSLRLEDTAVLQLPRQLSELRLLARLAVGRLSAGGSAPSLAAALRHLTQLTCLAVGWISMPDILPPSITALQRLQRLCIDVDVCTAPPLLPPGPWLASLRWLGFPWNVLAASVGALRGMQQLEYLTSTYLPDLHDDEFDDEVNSDRWRAWWDFVATHPPLLCLGMEAAMDSAEPTLHLLDALIITKHCRPALQVRRVPFSTFFTEVLDCTGIPEWPGITLL